MARRRAAGVFAGAAAGCRLGPTSIQSRIPLGAVVLRCTAKVLSFLGSPDLVDAETSDHDWYANLLWLDRRRCLLLAHAGTLFSVFVPAVHKADLQPVQASIIAYIQTELRAEGLPLDRFGVLEERSVRLAKTASRIVLGYMYEMGRFCEYAVADSGGLKHCDFQALNRELRRDLHLSRRPPGYFVPIELVEGAGVRAPKGRPDLRIVD